MTEEGRRERNIRYENIYLEEFELIYYMRGMTYHDVENMTGLDRKKLHTMLVDYLKEHPPLLM